MKKILLAALVVVLTFSFLGHATEGGVRVFQDGTFTGYSDASDKGYISVEVTIKDDAITDVKIHGYDGLGLMKQATYPWPPYHRMLEELPNLYIERDHWDVDIITGATGSSNQANQAVYRALARARIKPTNLKNEYFDGTFMAISDVTARGWTIAWVTIANDKIQKVRLVSTQPRADEDGETVMDDRGNVLFQRKGTDYPWPKYHEALEVLPKRMIKANSPDVDIVTGATGTSNQAMQAVEKALEYAKR